MTSISSISLKTTDVGGKLYEMGPTHNSRIRRSFLAFTFSYRGGIRTKVSEKAEKAFKVRVRVLTRRTRGHNLQQIIAELRKYLIGWKAYYGVCEVKRPFAELDKL